VDLFDQGAVRKAKATGTCVSCSGALYSHGLHVCPPGAAARATDPQSSHQAAHQVERSGKADSHRALCLKAVKAAPGSTSAEIAAATGLERHEAARRLPELRLRGLVRNGDQRECGETGNQSMTWWAL
jgi:hypothetical protein